MRKDTVSVSDANSMPYYQRQQIVDLNEYDLILQNLIRLCKMDKKFFSSRKLVLIVLVCDDVQ